MAGDRQRLRITADIDSINQRLWEDHQAGKPFSQEYYGWLSGQYITAIDSQLASRTANADLNAPDHVTRAMMHANVYHFSAAKSTAMMTFLNDTVKSASSFQEFYNTVSPALQDFNRNWLTTEYYTARQTGINAARWLEQQSVKDVLPYLQYRTQRDGRVRVEHAVLDGFTAPVDHPVWDTIYPPNGWRCRCFVAQLPSVPQGALTEASEAMSLLGQDELDRMRKTGFDRNRAKDGIVYDPQSFYTTAEDLRASWNETFSILNNGLKSYTDLLPTLARLIIPKRTLEYAEAWFKSKFGLNGLKDPLKVRVLDYAKRPVNIHWKQYQGVLAGAAAGEAAAVNLVDFVDQALLFPDEVFLIQEANGTYVYKYIKHYDPSPVVVIVEVTAGEITLRDWYTVTGDIDAERTGILIRNINPSPDA